MANVSFDFNGTTTVVTGGASGIGFTCAELIARCGGNVIISASRNADKTNQALSKLRAANPHGKIDAYPCEVGSENSVNQFFGAIRDSGERIDFVINSAGVSPNTDFFEQTQQGPSQHDERQASDRSGQRRADEYIQTAFGNQH